VKPELAPIWVKKVRDLGDKYLLISNSCGQIEKSYYIHIIRRLIHEQFLVFHETAIKPLEAVGYADSRKFISISQQST